MIKRTFSFPYTNECEILKAWNIDITKALFFDIETTGFTPQTSSLYLIGAIFYSASDNCFQAIQWFDHTGHETATLLSDFFELATKYQVLIHFNGDGFDLPYLDGCAKQNQLSNPLPLLRSFDIYKQIKCIKKITSLDHLKQKSIEQYLDINREDTMNGGELINVYKAYLKENDKIKEDLLLLHNADDIKGMIEVLPILSYPLLLQGKGHLTHIYTDGEKTCFTFTLDYPVNKRISCGKGCYLLTANHNIAKLYVPVYQGELKYFYPNYKDYYYLPVEDTAIHKSVAFYVDRKYRTQAKAATCYSRKSGIFLPQPEPIVSPYFKKEYKDTTTYFEADDECLNQVDAITEYVKCLLSLFS